MIRWLVVLLVVAALVIPSAAVGCGEDEEEAVYAHFTASPTSGLAPLAVSFTDQSVGEITEWAWDFGDGSTSTEQNPSHSYAAGDYHVSLTVTGPGGSDTETKADYIEAQGAVVAAFTASPVSGRPPLEVQFTDQSAEQSTGEVTAWEWDFDNDGTVDSTEQNPSYTYGSVGTYSVSLAVTGPEGSDTETKVDYIQVSDAVPTGTLTIATTSVSMEPRLGPFSRGAGTTQGPCIGLVYDSLIWSNRDVTEYNPGLAESWVVSEDHKSITFTLRQGVKFHPGPDGQDYGEMTSEDVKFSFETLLDPTLSRAQQTAPVFEDRVDHLETNGDYEVTVYYTGPFAEDFLRAHIPYRTMSGITSKAYFEEYYDPELADPAVATAVWGDAMYHPLGTGPYRFVDYELGSQLTLEAVEDHWRVVPEFKTIIVKEVPELMTRVAMVQTGEADIAIGLMPEQVPHLEAAGVNIATVSDDYFMHLKLGGQYLPSRDTYDPTEPFLNKNVRKALALAINREEIAEEVFWGYAQPTGIMTTHYGLGVDPYPYDPDQAMELLEAEGYGPGNPLEVDLWILLLGGAGEEKVADVTMAVAGYWSAVGVTAHVTQYGVMSVYGDIMGRKMGGIAIVQPQGGGIGQVPFLSGYATSMYSEGNFQWPWVEYAELDALFKAAYEATGATERDAAVDAVYQWIYDEYAIIPVVAGDSVLASGDTVAVESFKPFCAFSYNLEYVTHAVPLGTYRLFEPEY